MFVLSMKTTRPRLAAWGVVLGLLLLVMVFCGRPQARTTAAGGDDAARVAYLQEQGYAVNPQWTDVREIEVPAVEAVPEAYRGQRVKCFTYATGEGDAVCLYEWNGVIIGAVKQE